VLFPRRRLFENLEDLAQFFCRDPRTGVLDLHPQAYLFRGVASCRNPQDDSTPVCEFHCISQQIDQDLAEFILIRHHVAG